MISLYDQLREAGLHVVEGRPRGRTEQVDGIDVELTRTGQEHDGAPDINDLVVPRRGTFYIERSGRVWMLALGPYPDDDRASVFVAAYREDSVTDAQADALAALLAVLDAAYGTDTPDVAASPGEGYAGGDAELPVGGDELDDLVDDQSDDDAESEGEQ